MSFEPPSVGLGSKAGIIAASDQPEGLRGAVHHRTAVPVAIKMQRLLGRQRAGAKREVPHGELLDLKEDSAPPGLDPRHRVVTADSVEPLLCQRLVGIELLGLLGQMVDPGAEFHGIAFDLIGIDAGYWPRRS